MLAKFKKIFSFRIKRYLVKKRARKFKETLKSSSESQKKALEICNFMLSKKETVLIYSGISDDYLMEYRGILCKIDDGVIVISDGFYSYDIRANHEILLNIKRKFLTHLESRKKLIEKNIERKITKSLEKLHQNLLEESE
jgi:hypothetical protein